jgi:hypothetical protein
MLGMVDEFKVDTAGVVYHLDVGVSASMVQHSLELGNI